MSWRSRAEDAYEEGGIEAVARQFGEAPEMFTVKHAGPGGAGSTYRGLTLPEARERAADIVRSQGEALTDDRAVLADYGYLAAEDRCLDIDPGDGRAEVALADGTTIWVWRS